MALATKDSNSRETKESMPLMMPPPLRVCVCGGGGDGGARLRGMRERTRGCHASRGVCCDGYVLAAAYGLLPLARQCSNLFVVERAAVRLNSSGPTSPQTRTERSVFYPSNPS